MNKVRPSDSSWPTTASWEKLKQDVGGYLIKVESSLAAYESASDSVVCQDVIKNLQNPYYIGEQAGATQTTGWLDALTPHRARTRSLFEILLTSLPPLTSHVRTACGSSSKGAATAIRAPPMQRILC